MHTKLEKQADRLWKNYSEESVKFWKKYQKLIKASKSRRVILPIPKSTSFPVAGDWNEAYHNLPQQAFEFYQSKVIKQSGLQLKKNVIAFLVGSGLTALSSFIIDSDFLLYVFMVGFLATREHLTTIQLTEKCTLQVNPDYISYTLDNVTKKIYLRKLVKMKLTKNAMILKADYGSLGVRTYKFRLKGKHQKEIPENTKKAIVDFIETVIAVNKAAKSTKK